VVLGLLAGVNLCWVFLSGSRGDLLMGLICFLFVIATTRGTYTRLATAGLVVLLGAVTLNSFGDLQERATARIEKLLDPEQATESRTSGRSDLALGGWHIFSENPFGVGTGGSSPTWANLGYIEGLSGFKYGENMAAHAGWIKVLTENGFVGFALLAAFVGSFAVVGWRQRTPTSVRLGLQVTAVLAAAFTSTEFQPKGLWLLAAGAAVILHREVLCIAFRGARRPVRWRVEAAGCSEEPAA
jgi:O-antigen ligase